MKANDKSNTMDITFAEYIKKHYQPWLTTHKKSGEATIARIKTNFYELLGDKKLPTINPRLLEQWHVKRSQAKVNTNIINRDLMALKFAINKAVEWALIKTNPITELKLSKADTPNPNHIRLLSQEEETCLRAALNFREEKIRLAQNSRNLQRQGYSQQSSLCNLRFTDAIKPMVLLSLNTGLRKGELFNLAWKDIDFSQTVLTVNGALAKNGKTRYVPLNNEALEVLQDWQQQQENLEGLVFPDKSGQLLTHLNRSWRHITSDAAITELRWHNMRHHFANSLIIAGVPRNIVSEILGIPMEESEEIIMTLNFGIHLTAKEKAHIVAKFLA